MNLLLDYRTTVYTVLTPQLGDTMNLVGDIPLIYNTCNNIMFTKVGICTFFGNVENDALYIKREKQFSMLLLEKIKYKWSPLKVLNQRILCLRTMALFYWGIYATNINNATLKSLKLSLKYVYDFQIYLKLYVHVQKLRIMRVQAKKTSKAKLTYS